MLNWRIYYDGGLTFDDSMGAPAAAPSVGIVSIVQRNECDHHPTEWLKPEHLAVHDGRSIEMLEGADYYFWRPDKERWFRSDLIGFLDQAANCGAVALKFGRYLTHSDWEALLPRMANDRLE